MSVDINDFNLEVECVYKNERYLARDNGAVCRLVRKNKKLRPNDNLWSFGKLNEKNGYLEFSSERVHRITATAFLGEPPTKEHVVDHIDTNKQNNRPQNLRWVTRLENVLLNPITAKRIAYVCGSVEKFLADPEKYRDLFPEPNLSWMKIVTIEEGKNSLERMLKWANSDNKSTGLSLDKWIFNREKIQTPSVPQPNYILSKTPNAAQRIISLGDKPNEFPSTPEMFNGDPLTAYSLNLKEGAVFFRNHNGEYLVKKFGFSKDKKSLYVLSKSGYVWSQQMDGDFLPIPISEQTEKVNVKDLLLSITEITYEDNLFVHERVEGGFHPMDWIEEIFVNLTLE